MKIVAQCVIGANIPRNVSMARSNGNQYQHTASNVPSKAALK